MRRFAALAALFVLTLSRFGAAAPVHARVLAWGMEQGAHDQVAPAPAVRLAVHGPRELGPRSPSRTHVPWTPQRAADAFALSLPLERGHARLAWIEHRAAGAWHRFTYDATAPPRDS